MYPIVIFDALRVKIRDADSRTVKNKAVYVVEASGDAAEPVDEIHTTSKRLRHLGEHRHADVEIEPVVEPV